MSAPIDFSVEVRCPRCLGSGEITRSYSDGDHEDLECPLCEGTGHISREDIDEINEALC